MSTPIEQLDADVLARESSLERAIQAAFRAVEQGLGDRLDKLTALINAAEASGEAVTESWLLSHARVGDLLDQASALVQQFSTEAEDLITQAQRGAAYAALSDTDGLMRAGIDAPQGVSVQLARLPVEAIGALAGRAFDGSPLSSLLGTLGPETADALRAALLTGIAAGDGPRDIARAVRDAMSTTYDRALLIARTEILNAYRAAALANYQANSDVVRQWEWHADPTACPECLAKHGQRHPLSDPFDEHPAGRCAPLPVTKSWAELGIEMSDDEEQAWDDEEAAHWPEDLALFDYTTQARDARGRWVKGAGSEARSALKAQHQAARAALRATRASERLALREKHATERSATPRGQRGALSERHAAERAALRGDHRAARQELSDKHAAERDALGQEGGHSGRVGSTSQAYGNDPNRSYEMQHRLVDMSEIQASNTAGGGINPNYDARLQPRDRSRAASQAQIDEVARKMNPDVLTTDFHAIDRGTPIIDAEGNVLSGNGRTLALQHAAELYPEKYAQYKESLKARAKELGIDPSEIDRMEHPVLVRELRGDVDPVAFAREANTSGTLRMSPLEQAKVDAQLLNDRSVLRLNVDEGQSIDQALRHKDNRPFVDDFLKTVPENERATLLTRDGQLNQMGLYRAKAAVYTRVFQGEAGDRMAESMLESLDPELKNVQTGISQSLPSIARANALIRSGQRAAELDITEDSAKAIDTLARIKDNPSLTANTPAHLVVDKYLNQSQLFGRELSPVQETLLKHFDSISRRPTEVKDFWQRYAKLVEHAPQPGQGNLFGDAGHMGKAELIAQLVGRQAAPAAAQAGMFSRTLVMFLGGGLPPVRKRADYSDIGADDLTFALFYDRIAGDGDALTPKPDGHGSSPTIPARKASSMDDNADMTAPVVRTGPIFKLGSYPDKQFSLSAPEAARAVRAFTPVPIDSEHKESVFDGKLGQLRKVMLKGNVLHGEMAVPRWLHDLFPSQPIPVSTTWSRTDKRIIGLALAANPRVSEAAMMAAFSAAQHEPQQEKPRMKLYDSEFWKNFFSGARAAAEAEDQPEAGAQPAASFAVEGAPAPAAAAQADPEVARLRSELATAKADRIASDAAHFADAQIAGHKALPAEREAMIAAFTQAAVDDGAHGAVSFSDGSTSSRVEQFKALFAARPAHTLTQELFPAAEGEGVGFAANKTQTPKADDKPAELSAARKAELMNASTLGRAISSK